MRRNSKNGGNCELGTQSCPTEAAAGRFVLARTSQRVGRTDKSFARIDACVTRIDKSFRRTIPDCLPV
jgi:hypothetical protein